MICAKCNVEKPLKLFAPDARLRSGRSSWCKECKKEYQRNFKRAQALSPEWKEKRAKSARTSRCYWYGISDNDYEEILALQGGGCAGCGRPPKEGRRLDIDHKHQPGDKKREPWERAAMVRGLLCHLCNRTLGIIHDNPETLKRLAAYLETPPAVPVVKRRFDNLVKYLEEWEAKKTTLGLPPTDSQSEEPPLSQ